MSHHNANGGYQQQCMIPHASQYQYGQMPELHIEPVPAEPWQLSQRQRSAQDVRNQRPSLTASVNIARNMSHLRDFSHMSNPQNFSPVDRGVRFSMPRDLSLLDPSHVQPYYDASASRGPDSAWSTYNLRTHQTSGGHGPSRQSNMDFRLISGPGSDIGSQALPSDEGYFSHNTRSIMSNEPNHTNQDLPANLLSNTYNMRVESVASESPAMSRKPSDQPSFVSSRSGKSRRACKCPQCPELLKCNSEFKKHMLKHDKPFKCTEPGCKRTAGFTTTNDLERHQRSLHRKGISKKSYKCAVEGCRNKEKLWPRLDNFKQHVERMHKGDDVQDVIQRSAWHPENADYTMEEETNVAPLDMDIAVSGMENHFSVSPTIGMPPVLEFPTPRSAKHSFSSRKGSDSVGNTHSLSRVSRSGPTSEPHNARIQKSQKTTRLRHHAPGLSAPRTQAPLLDPKTVSGVSGRSESKVRRSFPDSALSNAPQTKAEQQRFELKKKSERQSRSPSPADFESVMLDTIRKANDQAKCDDKSEEQSKPEKNAALMKMMSKLLDKGPGSSNIGQRRSNRDNPYNDKKCLEPDCDFAVARECDLRKHMKRHNRPYGCTYPKCHKRFGAKSDWKRHENSQHFQQEAFRCVEKLSTGEICGVHLHREGAFRSHLEAHHKGSCEDMQKQVDRSRIGKNCQVSYWCGICKSVEQLKERRNAAWDERFDHIAHHFEKEKRSIDEWICAEENQPKKVLFEEREKRNLFENEDGREKGGDVDADGDDDDAPQSQPLPPHTVPGIPMPNHATTSTPPPPGFVRVIKRKLSVEDDTYAPPISKRRQTTTVTNRYCCSCENPCGAVDVACVTCTHELCCNCKLQEEKVCMMHFPAELMALV